ncbi:GDSL-type esterase/lipase family protein [Treponema sp.]|uniref:GDSL-type esterase/lipase family protein n=1 Tax=Treponema sp. TaxID=166 RepID=UPI00388E8EA3
MNKFSKWVSTWGTATSITDRREAVYAKDITLRYPIRLCFDGNKIRVRFSNLTGTEDVKIEKAFVGNLQLKQRGQTPITIPAGKEITTDEIDFAAKAGQTVNISLYLKDCTQMNAGTLVTGPLSGGIYAYGDFAEAVEFPEDLCRPTSWYYFLNTVDIFTEEKNRALCCYGDSITAQDWPDYLQKELEQRGIKDIAVIRRAVCGTRILRQYDCITYQAYGLKGETRFPIETNIAGLESVIIQHGINDIIHPVGVEVNKFRPMTDMPTFDDLKGGVEMLYLDHCKKNNLKVYSGTLLPIYGWRTYEKFREELRVQFNEWLRTSKSFDGCIDFDQAVRDSSMPVKFAEGFDSGDHLHPSKDAYRAMAKAAADFIEKNM